MTTLAGQNGVFGATDGTGTAAHFEYTSGIAADASGNAYVADSGNDVIRKVTPQGAVTTLAGQDGVAGETDGLGPAAQFDDPTHIAVAPDGNLYVADRAAVRIVTPSGQVSTLRITWDGETPVVFALVGPMAFDPQGNLYIANWCEVLKVPPSGIATVLAGQLVQGSLDGSGAAAEFATITGVAVDSLGEVYVSDGGANNVRLITPAGLVSTIAGFPAGPGFSLLNSGAAAGFADGTGTSARFNAPLGIGLDAAGNLYVADGNNHAIRLISPANVVTTIAGGPVSWSRPVIADGVGYNVGLSGPNCLTVDRTGDVDIGDGTAVRQGTNTAVAAIIDASPSNSTIPAGDSTTFRVVADGNPALSYEWQEEAPGGSWVDVTDGGVYSGSRSSVLSVGDAGTALNGTAFRCLVANTLGSATSAAALLYVSPPVVVVPLQVSTLAGQPGANAGSSDGPAGSARFTLVFGVAVDNAGNTYVADNSNHKIRQITSGTVTTLAGTGTQGFADGAAATAEFSWPTGIAVDGAGNVYVTDSGNSVIRRIGTSGAVSTFAGHPDVRGALDGTGTGAYFDEPYGIAIDSLGNLYVTDSLLNSVRKISPAGVVTTIAGGQKGANDGKGATAEFNGPQGIAVDALGNLYVADTQNDTIRKIDPSGNVTTVAGQAGAAGAIDGLAQNARFNSPGGVAVDLAGDIFVADAGNYAIREITPDGVVSTVAGMLPTQANANTGGIANGIGASAQLNRPGGLAIDATGAVTIADSLNYSVRKGVPVNAVMDGGAVQLSTLQTGAGSPAGYQWLKNSVPIAGATAAEFAISAAAPSDAGDYAVQTTDGDGGVSSSSAVPVTVLGAHLVNVSIRGYAGSGQNSLIVGFTTTGSGLPLLLRGVGPALSGYGVASPLANPLLAVYSGSSTLASNSGWANSPLIAEADTRVGAFTLPVGSSDAALLVPVASGSYTALVSGADGGTGVALAEAYDEGLAPAAHLINISGRAQVTATNPLIAGFSVTGQGAVQVLVRAAGPALTPFGVPGVLASPQIQVFDNQGNVLAQNANWSQSANAAAVASEAQAVGAFAFAPGSSDAAVLLTLGAGTYTAEVTGLAGTSGIALVEVYEVP